MRLPRIVPVLLLATACGGAESARQETMSTGSADMAESAPASAIVPEAAPAEPAPSAAQGVEEGLAAAPAAAPMLIRAGNATVVVDSLERGVAALRALAARHGGYVGGVSMTGGARESRHATLELRIPSARFDSALAGLNPVGRVESVSVSAEDVGEEYADVEARVANARRLEARLLDLLERRTGRLEELLQLEREVARVREEIERYEGRMRYLRTRASVSTLMVTLHEPEALIGPRAGEQPIRDAFRQAWENFVYLVAGLIAASGVLLPLALLAFLAWRLVRRFRRRERAGPATPPAGGKQTRGDH
jgi:hypothetical protein